MHPEPASLIGLVAQGIQVDIGHGPSGRGGSCHAFV
jgi:hypothetical protein